MSTKTTTLNKVVWLFLQDQVVVKAWIDIEGSGPQVKERIILSDENYFPASAKVFSDFSNADFDDWDDAEPTAMDDVTLEHEKQISKGYDADHDLQHGQGQLVKMVQFLTTSDQKYWPANFPDDYREELSNRPFYDRLKIAAALIPAEINRAKRQLQVNAEENAKKTVEMQKKAPAEAQDGQSAGPDQDDALAENTELLNKKATTDDVADGLPSEERPDLSKSADPGTPSPQEDARTSAASYNWFTSPDRNGKYMEDGSFIGIIPALDKYEQEEGHPWTGIPDDVNQDPTNGGQQ